MPGYWLFKSEPEEFSIDDLAASENQSARWDGIRNHQARNFIRDKITSDDLVFFYHSSCKHIGIVGICTVSSKPYPDPTQFDPASGYVDETSTPVKPKWFSVDLRLLEKFACIIPIKALKQIPELQGMVLLNNPRLSIQPVSPEEWQLIIKMVTARPDTPKGHIDSQFL